jgi:hypothetical protein
MTAHPHETFVTRLPSGELINALIAPSNTPFTWAWWRASDGSGETGHFLVSTVCHAKHGGEVIFTHEVHLDGGQPVEVDA